MDSSSRPTVTDTEHLSSGEENLEKTTHPRGDKWYASNYRTKYPSDPEMMATVERITNESTQEMTDPKHENGIKNQRAVSLKSASSTAKRESSPPLHFGRVAVELSTIKDITTGIRDEVSAYSNLERRYVRELERKLPNCEGMGDIRMHMTVDQLERIRRYRRNALAELTDMTVKIAALESRVERIAFEAAEAELNAKLAELEALYCVPEIDVFPETASATPVASNPTVSREKATLAATTTPKQSPSTNSTKPKASVIIPDNSPKEKNAQLVVPKIEVPKTTEKDFDNTVPESKAEYVNKTTMTKSEDIENTHNDIPSAFSSIPATNLSNKQVVALRELLTDYKNKKIETLSTGKTNEESDDDSTSTVDSGSGGTVMQEQLASDQDNDESIEDLLKEARESRHRLSANSIRIPIHISGRNKKLVIAAGAGSSVAAGIWMLEARTGMISRAFSGILRMLG